MAALFPLTPGDELRTVGGLTLAGTLLGLLFDAHRAWRTQGKPRPLNAATADLAVWLAATAVAVGAVVLLDGGLRGYTLLGIALGGGGYHWLAHPVLGPGLESAWRTLRACRRRMGRRRKTSPREGFPPRA